MKTIFEHTQTHLLVIPQALFAMQDVTVLKQHRNSAIFYKCLEQDLVDIEFYTNTPCFIYIANGREVITNSNNETLDMMAGSALFLPQGLSLHSDFVKETESLHAYLVFFDDKVVIEYLSQCQAVDTVQEHQQYCYLLENNGEFAHFFASIQTKIKNPAYLNSKLQELLHLIALQDQHNVFCSLLSTTSRMPPKRNLARLLASHDVLHLTVSDLAHISGRSLSSFQRDFKAHYHVSPKKWLQEKKLAHAKTLLEANELTVTEVAAQVGYDNVSNFIKAFKLQYGQTPKQIKRLL